MNCRDTALEYLKSGWLSVPLVYRQKAIYDEDWQSLRLDTPEKIHAHFNCKPMNIGVLTGEPSGGLIDVDIDVLEGLPLADAFLPSTRTFGRDSKPSSHRLYLVQPVLPTRKFEFKEKMIVEFRSTGGQTVFPPSVHPSGEESRWMGNGKLMDMDGAALLEKVGMVAAGALLARHWPKQPGTRDSLAMALAGGLLKAGWAVDEAEKFILAVCKAAHDEESQARARKARSTEAKRNGGSAVTGWRRLSELLGKDVVTKVQDWLGAKQGLREEIEGLSSHLTDLGNSERLVAQHGEDIRYCHDWHKWLYWSGTHWEPDATAMIYRLSRQTVRNIYAEAAKTESKETRQAIVDHAKRCEGEGRIKSMVSLAESEIGIPIRPSALDTQTMLLNCRNVTIDLSTGEPREHRRSDFITRCIPVDYDPDALCPTFDRFLTEIMGNIAELIDFIQRAVGYSLTGSTVEQIVLLLWGSGANGKSTLLEVLRQILGDYARHIQAESLMIRKFDNGQTNDIASLKGARLVTSIETEEGHRLAEAKIKSFSGGDTIMARYLYSEFFEFKPEFKIWLACNHKPVIRGTDLAIWRRIRLIPFTVSIPDDRQDKKLPEKLHAELPGILAWAVRGCLAWQKDGLVQPEEIIKATGDYQTEMDTLAMFLSDCCIEKRGDELPASRLYSAYRSWAEKNGEHPMTQTAFGRKLGERGFDSYRSGKGMIWLGLRLIEAD